MFDFLQLISSTQMAIILQIGVGNEYVDCKRLVKKPEFSKFMHQFGPKIRIMRIKCCAVDFEKFYNDNMANLENLSYLVVMCLKDKV